MAEGNRKSSGKPWDSGSRFWSNQRSDKRNESAVVDYKDLDFLKSVIGGSGKITSPYSTGRNRQQQSEVAQAVKRARFIGLIPYCESHK